VAINRKRLTFTHRFAELLHQNAELAAELATDADERQLAELLNGRVTLEYLLDERILALGDQRSQRRVQRVVVLLNELCLSVSTTNRHCRPYSSSSN